MVKVSNTKSKKERKSTEKKGGKFKRERGRGRGRGREKSLLQKALASRLVGYNVSVLFAKLVPLGRAAHQRIPELDPLWRGSPASQLALVSGPL